MMEKQKTFVSVFFKSRLGYIDISNDKYKYRLSVIIVRDLATRKVGRTGTFQRNEKIE